MEEDNTFQDTIDWASDKSEGKTKSIGIPLFYLIMIALAILIILVLIFYFIGKTSDKEEVDQENDDQEYYDLSENMEIDDPNQEYQENYSNQDLDLDQDFPDQDLDLEQEYQEDYFSDLENIGE